MTCLANGIQLTMKRGLIYKVVLAAKALNIYIYVLESNVHQIAWLMEGMYGELMSTRM